MRNRNLPRGLYKDASGYILQRIDNTRVRVGKNKREAIRLARAYNERFRNGGDLLDKIFETGGAATLASFLVKFKGEILPARSLAISTEKEIVRKLNIINKSIGDLPIDQIDLFRITKLLESQKSDRMFNQFRSLLVDIWSEMIDQGLAESNIPQRKKPRKETKERRRLSVEGFKAIINYEDCPNWLRVAMRLSLQTTHSRAEMVSAKYEDVVDGFLRIRRKKTKKYAAALVEIPVSDEIAQIIKDSRDNIPSPFIVHFRPQKISQARRNFEHWTQITPDMLSREFMRVRDACGFFDDLKDREKPTFHEIRALSIHEGKKRGFDMQARAAHSDEKMTAKYNEGHGEQWNRVPNIEIKI